MLLDVSTNPLGERWHILYNLEADHEEYPSANASKTPSGLGDMSQLTLSLETSQHSSDHSQVSVDKAVNMRGNNSGLPDRESQAPISGIL